MLKSKFLLVAMLVGMQVFAETSLIVYPLSDVEQATALSTIGYIKLRNDSMFIYSKADVLLGQNSLSNIHKVTYEDRAIDAINEIQSYSSVMIYPNPTHDALVIKNANCEVARIFNMNGQLLMTANIDDGNATLHVNALSQGTYLLQLNTEFFKFIKQ